MSVSPSRYAPGVHVTPGDLARTVAALVCAGSAGVHGALVLPHLHESHLLGSAFAVDAALLAVSAARVSERRRGSLPVAAVLATTALAYVLSRTTGLPGVLPDPEPVDGLGVLTTSWELVGVAVCLLLTFRKEHP